MTLPPVDTDIPSDPPLPDAEEILALVTGGAADGITIQDAQGRLVYANLAAAQLSGYESVEAFLGAEPTERLAHWRILTEDGDPFPVEDLPGRRVLVGETEAEAVLRVRDRRDEREFWSLVKATATFDERGRVRYAINVFREITGQKEAEFQAKRQATQMSHLYAITAALSGTTDVTAIAETLADQTLTAFGAVRGAVVLRSEDEDMLETVAWRGHNATAIEHWRRFALDDTNPIGAAILRNEPVVLVDADDWLARFPGLDREQVLAAAAAIPLDIGGRAIGGLTLSFDRPRGFTPDDIGFMLGAARQGAQALERARSDEVRRLAEERLAPGAGGRPPRPVAGLSEDPHRRGRPRRPAVRGLGHGRTPRAERVDRHAGGRARDPEKIAMAKEFRRHRPPDLSAPTGLGHAIATGEPEMVPRSPRR